MEVKNIFNICDWSLQLFNNLFAKKKKPFVYIMSLIFYNASKQEFLYFINSLLKWIICKITIKFRWTCLASDWITKGNSSASLVNLFRFIFGRNFGREQITSHEFSHRNYAVGSHAFYKKNNCHRNAKTVNLNALHPNANYVFNCVIFQSMTRKKLSKPMTFFRGNSGLSTIP